MALRARWKKAERRFAAYSLRERAIIGGAAVIAVAMLGSTLWLEPEMIRVKTSQQSLLAKEGEIAQLKAQATALQSRAAIDPDAAMRQDLAAAQQRLQSANDALLQANAAMVPATRMNAVLERILARQKNLRLVAMRTLEPASFIDKPAQPAPADAKAVPGFDIYRHGVEVKLAGSYADLHAYVRQLEAEKQKFLWGEMRIQVKEYPNAEMTLVLYTLSMEKAWLSL